MTMGMEGCRLCRGISIKQVAMTMAEIVFEDCSNSFHLGSSTFMDESKETQATLDIESHS